MTWFLNRLRARSTRAAAASEALFLTTSLLKTEATIWLAGHVTDAALLRALAWGLAVVLTVGMAPLSAWMAYRLQATEEERKPVNWWRLMWSVLATQPISWFAALAKSELTIWITVWITLWWLRRLACYSLAFGLTAVLSPLSARLAYKIQRDGFMGWLRAKL